MPYNDPMRYMEYFYAATCHITWIINNQHFNLDIINDCRPARMFSVFKIKISTSELGESLTNSILNTFISINGTYIFLCVQSVFFLSRNKEASNDKNASHFLPFVVTNNNIIEKNIKLTLCNK